MNDEQKKARDAILQRRAKLIALTLTSTALAPACFGKAEGEPSTGDSDRPYEPGGCLTMVCLGACLEAWPDDPPPDYPCLTYCDPLAEPNECGLGGFGGGVQSPGGMGGGEE